MPADCCYPEAYRALQFAPFDTAFTRLASHTPGVFFFSIWRPFCSGTAERCGAEGMCSPFIPGTNLLGMHDYQHLSLDGAHFVGARLRAFLRSCRL